MTMVNWSSPAITVTALRAWIMPTWIFWVATMMLPREETRRWTVRGPAGRGEAALARRAPRSLGRPAGGTGQAIIRSGQGRAEPAPVGLRPGSGEHGPGHRQRLADGGSGAAPLREQKFGECDFRADGPDRGVLAGWEASAA